MRDVLADFTPERWAAAKEVLQGNSDTGVSWSAAARAAGVSVPTLRGWVKRSGEQRPEDDPLVHEIAVECQDLKSLQRDRLEDTAWERAIVGVEETVYFKGEEVGTKRKPDNRLLMRILEQRDPSYRTASPAAPLSVDDTAEIYRRLQAAQRIAEAQREAEEQTVDMAKGDDDVYAAAPA